MPDPTSEWRPMSEAPRICGECIIICRVGSTDHYMVAEWTDDYDAPWDQPKVMAWCDQASKQVVWTDESMDRAFSPAMWKPLGPPPPSSICHSGEAPQWILDWRSRWCNNNPGPA